MPAASREENGLNGEKFICKIQVRNFPCTVLFTVSCGFGQVSVDTSLLRLLHAESVTNV